MLGALLPVSVFRKNRKSSSGSRSSRGSNRAQRRVRWARGDFCGGKSHFPEQKSFPCSFRARKSVGFQRKLAVGVAVAGGARSARPVGETARSKPNEAGSAASELASSGGCEVAGGARTRPKGVHSAGTPRRRRRGRCEDAGRPLRIVDSLLPRHQLVKKSF